MGVPWAVSSLGVSPGTEPLTTEHTNLSMPLFSVLTDVYGTTLLK